MTDRASSSAAGANGGGGGGGGFRGFAAFASHTDYAATSSTAAATLAAARAARSGKKGGEKGGDGKGGKGVKSSTKEEVGGRSEGGKPSDPSGGGGEGGGRGGGGGGTGRRPRPSPIYSGSDPRLATWFRKIGQKRDPVTKARALEELAANVFPPAFPPPGGGDAAGDRNDDNGADSQARAFPRPEKVAALSHLLHLHETKLGYDNVPAVRGGSYKALAAARYHVPKAWTALLLGDVSASGDGGADDGRDAEDMEEESRPAAGMAWAAASGDPAAEVRAGARAMVEGLIAAEASRDGKGGGGNGSDGGGEETSKPENPEGKPGRKFRREVRRHSKAILGCKRPSSLKEVVDPASASSASNLGGDDRRDGDGKGGKHKKDRKKPTSKADATASAAASAAAESEREEAEERYERVVTSTLRGLGDLLEACPESEREGGSNGGGATYAEYATMSSFPESASLTRLLRSPRPSFRREAYVCAGKICRFAPSLIVPPPTDGEDAAERDERKPRNVLPLGSLLPALLTAEKDGSNFPVLFELILSHLGALNAAEKDPWGGDDDGDGEGGGTDPAAFAKALGKALKKGCRGAPAAEWAPAILPIVASLPSRPVAEEEEKGEVDEGKDEAEEGDDDDGDDDENEDDENEDDEAVEKDDEEPLPLSVVSALWEGRIAAASSPADASRVVAAAAESAAFLLLRRRPGNSSDEGFSTASRKACGRIFLDAVGWYLREADDGGGGAGGRGTTTQASTIRGPAAEATAELRTTLARDLRRLDAASSVGGEGEGRRGIASVAEWTWGTEGLEATLLGSPAGRERGASARMWDALLEELTSMPPPTTADSGSSNLIPACASLFRALVADCSAREGKQSRPAPEEGELLLTLLRFCGPAEVFAGSRDGDGATSTYAAIERFCVNDLLRWILLRSSSSLRSPPTAATTATTDFDVLRICLDAIPSPSRRKKVWEAALRELIRSNCECGSLAAGLATMAAADERRGRDDDVVVVDPADLVRCATLDDFAVEAAAASSAAFRRAHYDAFRPDDDDDRDEEEEEPSSPLARGGPRGDDVSPFLRACVGLAPKKRGRREIPPEGSPDGAHGALLVSSSVVRRWVDLCCCPPQDEAKAEAKASSDSSLLLEDEAGSNVLLGTLLDLLAASPPGGGAGVLSEEEASRLLRASWREGGPIWDMCASREAIVERFVRSVAPAAYASLRADVRAPSPPDRATRELSSRAWAGRAARLIAIAPGGGGAWGTGGAVGGLLEEVGLGAERWDRGGTAPPPGGDVLASAAILPDDDRADVDAGSSTLAELVGGDDDDEVERPFLCLMHLLHAIDDPARRRDLVFGSDDRGRDVEAFVRIQASVVARGGGGDGGDDSPLASFDDRTVRCREMAEALGGPEGLGSDLLEGCCLRNAELLSSLLSRAEAAGEDDGGDDARASASRALSSLSFLTGLLFPSPCEEDGPGEDEVDPASVAEGQILWYVRGDGRERVRCEVAKVHRDDYPNLYFTVKEEGSSKERQTVAGRLRRAAAPSSGRTREASPHGEDEARRERVGQRIADELVVPFLTASGIRGEIAAEAASVVVSQCGLVSSGLGSVRYDVYRALTAAEADLADALTQGPPSAVECVRTLRRMSLAAGKGVRTAPPSRDVLSASKVDPTRSIEALLRLYEDPSLGEGMPADDPATASFHVAALSYVAGASGAVGDAEVLRRAIRAAGIASDVLLAPGASDAAARSYWVADALQSLRAALDRRGDRDPVGDEEERALSSLTGCLADLRGDDVSGTWTEEFSLLLRRYEEASPASLLPAANARANELCDCLFDAAKRRCAFRLLSSFAKDSRPMQSGDDIAIPPDTERRLSAWKESLEEEEGIELEEDVSAAASWLPERLMTLLQDVGEADSDDSAPSHPDAEARCMGNLLAWITSLDVLDAAGSADMRNRSHISSYVQKTRALGRIMTSALEEADLDVGRDEDVFACLDRDGAGELDVRKVATLAAFRTVESLPTLVKSWHGDGCPRHLRRRLGTFVEDVVAPATLKRELARIKEATSFGEMTVAGSCVSREVVATYRQDECQLGVMIRMPPTFPLRNVEVDCQKTKGIAESRWRRWALQITLMLNNQDGSVLDALLLWKRNVDKEFDGVEPCPVCYSVLCIKTHRMPDLECKTCNNRFHTQCLYKWFQSSGKSQCVLCQQPWSGTKV